MAKKKAARGSEDDVLRVFMALIGGALLLKALTDWEEASAYSIVAGSFFMAVALGLNSLVFPIFTAGFAVSDFFSRLFFRRSNKRRKGGKAVLDLTPLKADGNPRPVPTLKELASNAAAILEAESDLDDDPFIPGPQHSELDLLRQLYGHWRCDWFAVAVNAVTGWEIVAAGSPGESSVHRLLRDPFGRLVDVYGYVTMDDLRKRYEIDDLEIFEENDMNSAYDLQAEYLPDLAAAMLYLKVKPFVSMRAQVLEWVKYGPQDVGPKGRL